MLTQRSKTRNTAFVGMLRPAAQRVFHRSSVPPQHFEHFLQLLVKQLGFENTPESYACGLYYDQVLDRVRQLGEQLRDARRDLQKLLQAQGDTSQGHSDYQAAAAQLRSYSAQKRAQTLENRNIMQQKMIAELYQLRDEHKELLQAHATATDRILAQHAQLYKMQERLDSVNLQNVAMREQLEAARKENEALRTHAGQMLSENEARSEKLITSLQKQLEHYESDSQVLQTSIQERSQLVEGMQQEIERLTSQLDESYAEGEVWRKRFHFQKLETDTLGAVDAGHAYRRISQELQQTQSLRQKEHAHYQGVIDQLGERLRETQKAKMDVEQHFKHALEQKSLDNQQLERKIVVLEGEKRVLMQDSTQKLRDMDLTHRQHLEQLTARKQVELEEKLLESEARAFKLQNELERVSHQTKAKELQIELASRSGESVGIEIANRIISQNEEIANLNQQLQTLKDAFQRQEQDYLSKDGVINELQQQIDSLTRELADLGEDRRLLQEAYQRSVTENLYCNADEREDDDANSMRRSAELQQRNLILSSTIVDQEARLSQFDALEKKNQALEGYLEDARKQIVALQDNAAHQEDAIRKLNLHIVQLSQSPDAEGLDLEALRAQNSGFAEMLNQANDRLALLEREKAAKEKAEDTLLRKLVGMTWSICKVAKIQTDGASVDAAVARVLEYLGHQ